MIGPADGGCVVWLRMYSRSSWCVEYTRTSYFWRSRPSSAENRVIWRSTPVAEYTISMSPCEHDALSLSSAPCGVTVASTPAGGAMIARTHSARTRRVVRGSARASQIARAISRPAANNPRP
jgi:hypothetical protein